jgi:hypothetical protein
VINELVQLKVEQSQPRLSVVAVVYLIRKMKPFPVITVNGAIE